MNILHEADQIINHRSEEKERQYGPVDESMTRMRDIFNAMTGLELTTGHMFDAMVSLKLARMGYSDKEDTYLDAVAYLGAKNNYLNRQKDEESDDLPF